MTEGALTENDVVDAVCAFLESRGCSIKVRARTTQRGPDIVARLTSGQALYVETKGATSARQGSARFGQPFDSAAVRVHVAEAFHTAAAVSSDDRSAVALPDDHLHKRYLDPVRGAMSRLGIGAFWVGGLSEVRFEAEWGL